MNIGTIRTALFQWASANSGGNPVVWADQAAPRPARPFVTLRLNGPFRDLGADELRHTGVEGEFEICGHRRLVLSVQVVGTADQAASLALAVALNLSLSKPSVLSALSAAGLAVSDAGDVRNLTAYLDTQFEARFAFDTTLMAVASTSDSLGSIRSVEITSFGKTAIVGESE